MANDRPAPTGEHPSEVTFASVGLGLLLAVIMGAANVYLGLKVGMTVAAAIPAAVMGLAILNGLMRRKSILEANIVQTAASAGESLAAGVIFTMPALVIIGVWETFDYWTTTLVAMTGGLLGALFMIPMRRVFIVNSPELKFPEGVACAEVLRAGQTREDVEQAETGAISIFLGLAVGAVFKLCESFLGLLAASVEWATFRGGRVFYFGADIAPALLGVGLIVGLSIAAQVFLGGAIGWLISVPLLSEVVTDKTAVAAGISVAQLQVPSIGVDTIGWLISVPLVTEDITGASALDVAKSVASSRVRYIGVGAMLVGGLVSIWHVRAGLVAAVRELWHQFKPQHDVASLPETERNLPTSVIALTSILTVAGVAGIYYSLLHSVGVTIVTTIIMVVMAFFFTAVASYIVGLVGGSNSPVSGMTITAVLFTGAMLLLFTRLGVLEAAGTMGKLAILGVAGVVCCAASTAGDMCNDLKTGYLVGASPRRQQAVELAAVVASALVMAPVLTVLHEGSIATMAQSGQAGGIGIDPGLSAPQATLFASLANGFFGDKPLPWNMVLIGMAIGVAIFAVDRVLHARGSEFRLHVMPVAVGMYLPFRVAVPMLIGGIARYILDRRRNSHEAPGSDAGVLVASGIIAGESLFGVLLAFFAYMGISFTGLLASTRGVKVDQVKEHGLAEMFGWSPITTDIVSITALLAVALWMYWMAARKKK